MLLKNELQNLLNKYIKDYNLNSFELSLINEVEKLLDEFNKKENERKKWCEVKKIT